MEGWEQWVFDGMVLYGTVGFVGLVGAGGGGGAGAGGFARLTSYLRHQRTC